MAVTLQYVGWSSFLFVTSTGKRILVDPYLEGSPDYGVAPSNFKRADLYPLDVVAVSHASVDHLGEAFEISKESGAMICGGLDVKRRAAHAGHKSERFATMVSGATFQGDGWKVKALEARHISLTELDGQHLTGQPMSFLFHFGDVRVFFGGDTSISSDLELFGRLYKPDVALLGIDGTLENGRPIVDLDPIEAARAIDMLGAHVAIPMHFRSKSTAPDDFIRLVNDLLPDVHAIKLAYGESITVTGLQVARH
jgi:L-ascorbate metabolism protein UlaG (beta-lactamase superfamily)